MKNKLSVVSVLALAAAFQVLASPAQADISISYSNTRYHPQKHYRQHAYRYAPRHVRHYHGHHFRPQRVVYTTPIVHERVVYVTPSPARSYGTPDKEQDVAVFRERVSELRSMIHEQKEKGGLSTDTHERLIRDLDNLERDEHARTYDRGGRLHADDFADLYYRLNETSLELTRLAR